MNSNPTHATCQLCGYLLTISHFRCFEAGSWGKHYDTVCYNCRSLQEKINEMRNREAAGVCAALCKARSFPLNTKRTFVGKLAYGEEIAMQSIARDLTSTNAKLDKIMNFIK